MIPPARDKLDSDTLIGFSVDDALRRRAALNGSPLPPPRSSVATLVGGLASHPGSDQESSWPPRWHIKAPPLEREDTPIDWCTALRSTPGLLERPKPSRAAAPSQPVAPPWQPLAPAMAPAPSSHDSVPGGRTPSTDTVFVASVAPPEAPQEERSRLPMIALLLTAFAAVAAMAGVAIVQNEERGPVWRLAETLPEAQLAPEQASEQPAPKDPARDPAKPSAKDSGKGTLIIDAGPAGCEVWIDGVGRMVRGIQALPVAVGPHSVACRKAGRLDGRRVVVATGKASFVRFAR